jgi:hypothetical protein
MASPLIVLAASNSEAGEWRRSIWQQMLSVTVPAKYAGKFINPAAQQHSQCESRVKITLTVKHANNTINRFVLASFCLFSSGLCQRQSAKAK